MPTPKKKYPFNFIYEDGTYMTFDLTKDEHERICKCAGDSNFILTDAALINTKGLRFVTELKERLEDVEMTTTPDADPVLDAETQKYLRYIRQED